MNRQLIFIFMCIVVSVATVMAAEMQVGSMNIDSNVLADAKNDANNVGQLKKGTEVKIVDREGGWMKVQGNSVIGWVKSLSVKRKAGDPKASNLADVVTGRGTSGQLVSTSGTRGLDAEALKMAKFNKVELDKMENNKLDEKVAKDFANSRDLKLVKLSYPVIVKKKQE